MSQNDRKFQFTLPELLAVRFRHIMTKNGMATGSEFFRKVARMIIAFDDIGVSVDLLQAKTVEIAKFLIGED